MVPLSLSGKEGHAARGVSDAVGSQRIKRVANAVHANGSHGLTTAGGGCVWMCFFPLDTELRTKIARIVEGSKKLPSCWYCLDGESREEKRC
jgi:hypothetical protein